MVSDEGGQIFSPISPKFQNTKLSSFFSVGSWSDHRLEIGEKQEAEQKSSWPKLGNPEHPMDRATVNLSQSTLHPVANIMAEPRDQSSCREPPGWVEVDAVMQAPDVESVDNQRVSNDTAISRVQKTFHQSSSPSRENIKTDADIVSVASSKDPSTIILNVNDSGSVDFLGDVDTDCGSLASKKSGASSLVQLNFVTGNGNNDEHSEIAVVDAPPSILGQSEETETEEVPNFDDEALMVPSFVSPEIYSTIPQKAAPIDPSGIGPDAGPKRDLPIIYDVERQEPEDTHSTSDASAGELRGLAVGPEAVPFDEHSAVSQDSSFFMGVMSSSIKSDDGKEPNSTKNNTMETSLMTSATVLRGDKDTDMACRTVRSQRTKEMRKERSRRFLIAIILIILALVLLVLGIILAINDTNGR